MFHVKHLVEQDLQPAIRERLAQFADLLGRWNARINLISRPDIEHVWQRHILDSMQLVELLPVGCTEIIDLGSGAGFPGLVLAIATGIQVHLVEADLRKAAFLREAARVTAATARVHAVRAEALQLPPVRVVTARALAPLPALLGLAVPLLQPHGGICLFPKGRGVEDELTAAAIEWHMRVERFASLTSVDATLLRISEIHRAGQTP